MEVCAQVRQRDSQRGTINERHGGGKDAARKDHAAALGWYFEPELARARLGIDNAATTRLNKRLRHGILRAHPPPEA